MRKVHHPELLGFAAYKYSPIKKRRILGGFELRHHVTKRFNTEPATTLLSGGRMKIKFDRIEKTKTNPNAQGRTYNIIRVHGTALEGKNADQPWQTQFFANNKELAGQVEDLVKDDIVDVTMKKNGNYWNAQEFKKSSVPEYRPVANVKSGIGGCHSTNPRLENLKIAVKVLGPKPADEEPFDYLSNAAGIADMIQDYVEEKGAFQFGQDTSDGIPEVEEPGDSVD